MKAKYSIPYTLDKKLGNTLINLKDPKTGMGIDKKLHLRTLIVSFGAFMLYMFIITKSSLSHFIGLHVGSLGGFILFTLGYVGLCYFGLKTITIPELYGYNAVMPLISYLKRYKNNDIKTASFSEYQNASEITGFVEPTEDGKLRFNTGEYGYLYKVVGTASNNAFSVDREVAINSFEVFLRTLPDDVTYTFITNTSGQKVKKQIHHLIELYDQEQDIKMIGVIAEEIRELAQYIQYNFTSLHQYLLIRAIDKTSLKKADKNLKTFVTLQGGALSMIQRPTPENQVLLLHNLFSGTTEADDERIKQWLKNDHNTKSEVSTAGGFKNIKLKIKKKEA